MRSKTVAYLLWCLAFIGVCGIHRFYVGKWGTGLLWLFTGGLLFIGQIVDLFFIPSMVDIANLKTKVESMSEPR
jgi:TM2 domain-containing membrane protein YozV